MRMVRESRLVALLAALACADAEPPPRLVLGTTHTLEDSGLLEALVPQARQALPDLRLSVVVAGSGEILGMAARGDIDVLLTHSPDDEVAFVAAGRGESRHPVMHNDFVLLGPPRDPAAAADGTDVVDALRRIEAAGAPFVSRGDGSGTHRRERALWADAQTVPDWPGYVEAGTGMADVLRLAAQRGAYTLADRATFEVVGRQLDIGIVQQGDARLLNQYSVIVVTQAGNIDDARRLSEWLRSAPAQSVIAGYGMDRTGRALFDVGSPAARGAARRRLPGTPP